MWPTWVGGNKQANQRADWSDAFLASHVDYINNLYRTLNTQNEEKRKGMVDYAL